MAVEASNGAGRTPARHGSALDVHAHAMPLPLLSRLADRGLADLDEHPGRDRPARPAGQRHQPLAPLPTGAQPVRRGGAPVGDGRGGRGPPRRVELPPFLFASTSDDAQFVSDVVRPGNDKLAVYVADAPDRLLGLGWVPLGFPDAAEEARRCLDELGLAGIAIGSRGGGRDLDDPVNGELWALLAERGTFVFLHPSGVPDPKRVGDWYMPQLVGYPAETAIAIARMVFSGTLERHPIQLCLAHGGGCLPALRGRMDMGWEPQGGRPDDPAAAERVRGPPVLRHCRVQHDAAAPARRGRGRRARDDGHGPPVRAGRLHPGGDGAGTRAGRDRHSRHPLGRRGPAARATGRGPLTRPDHGLVATGVLPGPLSPDSGAVLASGRGTGSGTAHTDAARD